MKITKGTIQDAFSINELIADFEEKTELSVFQERLQGDDAIILLSKVEDENAGYVAAYDRYHDESIYCWMAAVRTEYRRQGLLTAMMLELEEWSRENNYKKFKIKTRNNRKEMQHYLISRGYEFTDVVKKNEDRSDFRLHLEKDL